MTFAQKIQRIRKDAGLSQEELAEQLGVSRQSVSKWELGQAYPETEKIVELSKLFHVSVDSLLRDGEPLRPDEPSGGGKTASRRGAGVLATVCLVTLCLALASALGWFALMPHDVDTGEDGAAPILSQPSGPSELEMLREYYFDFAQEYRLDYVPFFEAGKAPVDSTEYLYFAFAVNLDGWGEDKGIMTREYVDETALAYFGVAGLNHLPAWKSWDFDGWRYTAYPGGIKELPVYVLQEYRTYWRDGAQYHEITMTLCSPDSGELLKDEALRAMRGEVASGVPFGFSAVQTEVFVYRASIQNFEKPLFIAHTLAE